MTRRSPPQAERAAALALTAAFALAGCGGGNGGSDSSALATESAPPPATAAADAPAFAAYTSSLKPNDDAEPIALGDFVPPKDDTAEPTPVGG